MTDLTRASNLGEISVSLNTREREEEEALKTKKPAQKIEVGRHQRVRAEVIT